MDTPIWTPTPERVKQTNLYRFISAVRAQSNKDLCDYTSLYRWSIAHPRSFWPALWRFCDIRCSQPWTSVLDDGDRMPGARWFSGAKLNFAENLLWRLDDSPALVFRGENGARRSLSYRQLAVQVARLSDALRGAGVRTGDRIAACLPNIPETVVAMLATTSIGAIWSSCSPDFGVHAVVERFAQIRPKVIFAADGYSYNGRWIDVTVKVAEVLSRLPEVGSVIAVPYHAGSIPVPWKGAILYGDFIAEQTNTTPRFTQLPFDHPLYILYSSGTTGPPKCIVHGAGGTLLQHFKELVLHTDLKDSDTIFLFHDLRMDDVELAGLKPGGRGNADPVRRVPWCSLSPSRCSTSQRKKRSAYSAPVRDTLQRCKKPRSGRDTRIALHAFEPYSPPVRHWLPELFDYVYHHIKTDVQLSSISGGTDIVSCFALGCPTLPVYRGELQCLGLGMRVQVYDQQGEPVHNQKGELVCSAAFPSMPIGFWNDPDGQRYQRAYFQRFPGVWTHGDYAELTNHGGMIIHGRSDAVLNPGGVRIGTAEIYRQVEAVPEVLEAIAVGQEWVGDTRIILFVRLSQGRQLDSALKQRINQAIRDHASPRHVPAKVIQVDDIPRTLSGKLVEIAVCDTIHGRPVNNLDALANPETLAQFRNLAELDEE